MANIITDPEFIIFPDAGANAFRGEKGFTPESNFWNEPFPDTLLTVKGNIARFEKTWNKTHSSLKNRRCALTVEIEKSDGSTQIIEIGTFLIETISQNESETMIQLNDLSKALIDTPADSVKSGFQWYRNVPVKILVEELIKKVYPDPRNGEVPRDYIIEGIRPPSPTGEYIISSLGKPPGFARITGNETTDLCYSIAKHDFGLGERIYLGIGNNLYEYDEINQVYYFIGKVENPNGNPDYPNTFNIKKLWHNESDLDYLYGMAWPKEEVISDELLDVDGFGIEQQFACPVGNEFIIFKANREVITILFDSTVETITGSSTVHPKLFSGEFHIVPPYYVSVWTDNSYYNALHPNYEHPWDESQVGAVAAEDWKAMLGGGGFFETHVGYGNLTSSDPRFRQPITTQANLGSIHYWGRQYNLAIPFVQNIGFSCNFSQKRILPSWVDGMNKESGEKCFGFTVGIPIYTLAWRHALHTNWNQHTRPRLFIKATNSLISDVEKIRDTDARVNFIASTNNIDGFTNYEVDEVFNGYVPSIPYAVKNPSYEHLPYPNTGIIPFDPGYLAYYGEYFGSSNGYLYQGEHYTMPMPYLKYTSGQKGSVELIPDYGNKGGIFYQTYTKQNFTSDDKIHPRFRLIDAKDIVTDIPDGGHPEQNITTVLDMQLDCYIYDIETGVHYPLTNLDYNNFKRTTGTNKTYPKQITAVAINGLTLAITSMTYPNKNDYTYFTENEAAPYSYVDQCVLSGTSTATLTNRGYFADQCFTDAIWIENSVGTSRVILSSYDPSRILNESSTFDTRRPNLGSPYALWLHTLTNSNITQWTNYSNDQKRKLTKSELNQRIYYVDVENRNEDIGGMKLQQIDYTDSFDTSIIEGIELYTAVDALSVSDANSIGDWVSVIELGHCSIDAVLTLYNGYGISCTFEDATSPFIFCGMHYPVTSLEENLIVSTRYQITITASCEAGTVYGGNLNFYLHYKSSIYGETSILLNTIHITRDYTSQSFTFILPGDYIHDAVNNIRFWLFRRNSDGGSIPPIIGDTFTITDLSIIRETTLSNDLENSLGFISDVVYGDTNELSNLEVIEYENDGNEVVYGVTDGYYENPINKLTKKNHLWKYDKYLSGIIELADLSSMNIWDAITDLAYAFNYVTGFSNNIFFFMPKAINNDPDLILDIDNDGILKITKTQDYKVENIIRTTPYRARKGEIEWTVITTTNISTTNDIGRQNLTTELRIDQKDDLQKKVFLRVITPGLIPLALENEDGTTSDINGPTTIRFAYLIANNVIETKLTRDLTANSISVILPSLFGENTEDQVSAGDIFVIDYTDETTGDSYYYSRIIRSIDYNTNEIILESGIPQGFLAFTPVIIYRGFYTKDNILRNNKWSDSGVTIIMNGALTLEGENIKVNVASINHLSVGNLVQLGDWPQEFKIIAIYSADNDNTNLQYPYIHIKPFRSEVYPLMQDYGNELNGKIIKASFVPFYDTPIEIGGSKVWLTFAIGSKGSFWSNSRGQDRIEIICPGLLLESDSQSIITAADIDSIKKYGKFSKNLDSNKFIQISLAEYHTRLYLKWNSKPRLLFEVDDIIQAKDNGGQSYTIPYFKFLSIANRRLSNIRIISRKLLARFPDFSIDCYIIDHKINLKTFIQSIGLRAKDSY
jgi:hypothetical protein